MIPSQIFISLLVTMTFNVIIKNTIVWVGYLHTILGAHVNWAFVEMDGPTMQFAVD